MNYTNLIIWMANKLNDSIKENRSTFIFTLKYNRGEVEGFFNREIEKYLGEYNLSVSEDGKINFKSLDISKLSKDIVDHMRDTLLYNELKEIPKSTGDSSILNPENNKIMVKHTTSDNGHFLFPKIF